MAGNSVGILSTGIFSSERSKDTVFSGIREAQSTLEPRGSVIAYTAKVGSTSTVFKMSFVVSNAVAGEPVDLTPGYTSNDADDDPDVASANSQVTVVSYSDKNQAAADVPWTLTWLGNNDGDNLLEDNEKAEITVWVLTRDNTVTSVSSNDSAKVLSNGIATAANILGTGDEYTIQVKPPSGAVLNLKRRLPSQLDTVMDLN